MLSETQLIAAKIELQGYIHEVERTLQDLAIQLHAVPEDCFWRPQFMKESASATEIKGYVIQAFKNIYYDEGQEPVESRAFIGAAQVPASIGPYVQAVNDAKDQFEAFFASLNKQMYTDRSGVLLNGGRASLRNTEYARLHAHQTARHIPYIADQPICLSYTYLDTPVPKKVTKKRALNLVASKTPDDLKDAAFARLEHISEDEVLVWRKQVPPRPRVNIQLQDETWAQRAAVLPILYVNQGMETEMRFLNSKGARGKGRALVKLESEPVVHLPAIHRYKEQYRIFQTTQSGVK